MLKNYFIPLTGIAWGDNDHSPWERGTTTVNREAHACLKA